MEKEIDLNDFGIDDDDLQDLEECPDAFLRKVTLRGFRFAGACLGRARHLEEASELRSLVGTWVAQEVCGEDAILESTVRFFTRRGELPDRYLELERFEFEALAIIGLEDIPNTGHEVLDETLR